MKLSSFTPVPMIALLQQIPSEPQIRKQLRQIIYGSHLFCPTCHRRKIWASEGRYWCQRCRKNFSLLSGTWLAGLKLNLRTWYTLVWCWTQAIPVLQSQKITHVGEEAVYHWFRQFRLHLAEVQPILHGTVQMDEAYFRSLSLLLSKQVGTTKLAWQVLQKSSVDKRDAANFLFQNIQPRSRLHTDGSGIYKRIDRWWPVTHKKDIHKKWEFELTSEIEGMFGNLRTFIRRMYHHTTPAYLPEYVAEFAIRFSHPEWFISPRHYLLETLKPAPFD
jgi:transposase-like protein